MQTESGKTMMYVAAAVIMAVVGIALAPKGPKAAVDGVDGLIGTEFYKGFQDPAEATAIDVIGYDPVTATSTPFSVEYQDGLWRIPTRFNYPADAKDRLAKVGSSIIGLKREALAGRTEAEQAEFQVLDPKAEKPDNLKGIGNRVTLRKGNTVLADYIIGKQVPNRAGYYYVRKPDEKQTFIAKVELNLSTKFTDWIENDVLNVEGTRLVGINILRHTLELSPQPHLVGEENSVLKRKTSSDPWTLEGLDEATEEVNQDEVRKVVSALDDLKVVGVRPKPESLRRDLRSEEGIKLDQETAEDLADRGFYILRSSRGGHQMVAKEGDLVAGTDQGVEYEMHFGKVFEGTEEEIELGFAKMPADDDQPADATQKDEPKDESTGGKKKSRFIFVTARVNPELFGAALEEPVKPEPPEEKPAEEKPAEEKKEGDAKSEEKPKEGEAAKTDEKKEDGEKKDEQPAEEKTEAAEPAKPDPKAEYEAALKKYEADKAKYESELKSRDGKVKEAEEKVKALNARFADWYYVISAESFENLRPTRAQLVKAKPDAETKSDDAATEEPKEEADEATAKPDEKKADEKPADKKPEEKKPDAKSDAAKPKTETPAAKPKK